MTQEEKEDLIEKICRSIEAYKKQDGYIRIDLALRIVRSYAK